MALVQTYTCDKCGHEQPTAEQMWTIGVGYRSVDSSYSSYGSNTWSSKERMWCRKCLEDAGMVPVVRGTKRDAPAPTKFPAFEDLVRELIREEIASSEES